MAPVEEVRSLLRNLTAAVAEVGGRLEDRDDLARNVYVAMCYYKLDY